MAGSVNKAIVIGHLGKDPEVRRSQSGAPIVSFSVATSETWRDKGGERRERTEWHRVVVFNEPLAKLAEQHLKKGSKVYVEGAMKTRTWKDQADTERYTTEIVLGPFHATLALLDRQSSNRPPDADDLDAYGRPSGPAADDPMGGY